MTPNYSHFLLRLEYDWFRTFKLYRWSCILWICKRQSKHNSSERLVNKHFENTIITVNFLSSIVYQGQSNVNNADGMPFWLKKWYNFKQISFFRQKRRKTRKSVQHSTVVETEPCNNISGQLHPRSSSKRSCFSIAKHFTRSIDQMGYNNSYPYLVKFITNMVYYTCRFYRQN